jgi:transcriptional regulator with XRE-family HTH domain
MEQVLVKLKEIRKEKGYSHEYMAHQLGISQAAYSKLEKNETKLTVERLYKLAEILEVTVGELLEILPTNQFNQTNKENTTGYLQQTANFYQESKEQNEKIMQLYEARLQDKDKIIKQLENLVNNKQIS